MKYQTEADIVRAIKHRHKKRQPLNISAVREEDPDLLDAAYRQDPFLGWKQALEKAGLDYGDIVTRYQEEIECKICHGWFCSLTAHLLKAHEITPEEYRDEFPEADIVSETFRIQRRGSPSASPAWIPDWEPALSIEFALDKAYQYYREGCNINFQAIREIDSSIVTKLIGRYGSWDVILQILSIEPRIHRQNVRPDDYTLDDLHDWLKSREEAGLKNTREAVIGLTQDDGDQQRLRIVSWGLAYHNNSWQAVLDASGRDLSHPSYNDRNFPDSQSVIDAILEMHDAGRTTALGDVMLRVEDSYIAFAAPRYFGNWANALAAAGVEATTQDFRFDRKSNVVRRIKYRIEQGFPLDVRSLYYGTRRDQKLFKAGFRHFPSWRAAVKEVSKNQANLVAEASKDNPFSTRKKVIEAIRERHAAGKLASERHMPNSIENQILIAMAHGFFGSWREAAIAAGIDPKTYHEKNLNPTGFYATKEEVIEGILYRHKEEKRPMNARSVATGEDMDVPLIYAARKLFGSWENAVDAAGLDSSQFVRKIQDYSIKREYNRYDTKKDVIDAIIQRKKNGQKLNVRALKHGPLDDRDFPLCRRGEELFGSWEKALLAAGMDPAKEIRKKVNPELTKGRVYHSYKTKKEVIAGIRKRKREKKALNTKALQSPQFEDRDFALWKAGSDLFGSWADALTAAGIDLTTVFPAWQIKRMENIHKKREK